MKQYCELLELEFQQIKNDRKKLLKGLSNDKTISSAFGRLLLSLFHFEKYFRSPAMQGFFKEKYEQNKLV